MATTANTVQPISSAGGDGGTQAAQSVRYISTDAAIVKGDILITASGKADELNIDPTVGLIIGVANEPSTAVDSEINILEAQPGARFEGNIVGAAATDLASGVFATHLGVQFGLTEADTDALAAIDESDVTLKKLRTLQWARQRDLTQTHTPFAATLAVVNPRVVFVFLSEMTIFGPLV